MKAGIYNKVRNALTLYVEMWVVATLLTWLLVSILGHDDVEVMCSRDKATPLKEWLNR